MGILKFGKISTKDLDLVIQAPPAYNFPEKDLSREHIPGRNGDLIVDNNCWKNVERSYSIVSKFRPSTDFIENAERLVKWLTETEGYQRLEDSYDPDVYRMAEFSNSGSLVNYYDEATVLNITFNCKPQRYLKEGEIPVQYSGSEALLENPTGYIALPKITFNNLSTSSDEVLLVTVTNLEENKVTSTITLSKLPSGDLTLDSELQTVYSTQNGDVNGHVNLNGTEFPSLGKGTTSVAVNSYTEHEDEIEQYNNLIDRQAINTNMCLVKYRPYDSIVESKQKSFYIMSYDLLKQKLQEVYEMKSYAAYCLEKSEEFTFISFNTILDSKQASFTFQGDYSAKPDWLSITTAGDGTFTISAGNLSGLSGYNKSYGYFITSGTGQPSDKKILKIASNGQICSGVKNTSTVTVIFYPADSNGNLDVGYSEEHMPAWLDFGISYENGSPSKITFYRKGNGWFYTPKTGLFGKASWIKETAGATVALNSLSWSTSKRKFMPDTGLSTSTTAAFSYRYLPYPYSAQDTYLQYEPVQVPETNEDGSIKTDANGNPIMKTTNAVHFEVTVNGSSLESITIKAKDSGYFRLEDHDQNNGWAYTAANNQLACPGASGITVNSGTIIYYLPSIPNYAGIEGFPDWLDPTPIKSNGSFIDSINPETIDFKVKYGDWYKYSYESSNQTFYSEWTYKSANAALGRNHPVGESFTAYMLEGSSGLFPIKSYEYNDGTNTIPDIALIYLDSNGNEVEYPNNQPPSWLSIKIKVGEKADHSDWMLEFYPNTAGLYKWDNNSIWLEKEASSEKDLVTSLATDDTSVYYMASAPTYPTSGTIYDKCRVVVNQSASTGNPESITVYAKVAGYYRAKNNSNWKYYNIDDEICNSKISESTPISYLVANGNSLSGVSIEITPKWWRL